MSALDPHRTGLQRRHDLQWRGFPGKAVHRKDYPGLNGSPRLPRTQDLDLGPDGQLRYVANTYIQYGILLWWVGQEWSSIDSEGSSIQATDAFVL